MTVPALEFPGSGPTTQDLALVPDLTGVLEPEATATLRRNKLDVKVVTLTGEGDAGKVVSQDPAARAVVPQGTVVKVFVLAAQTAGDPTVLEKLEQLNTAVAAVQGDVSAVRSDVSSVKENVTAIKAKVVDGGTGGGSGGDQGKQTK